MTHELRPEFDLRQLLKGGSAANMQTVTMPAEISYCWTLISEEPLAVRVVNEALRLVLELRRVGSKKTI